VKAVVVAGSAAPESRRAARAARTTSTPAPANRRSPAALAWWRPRLALGALVASGHRPPPREARLPGPASGGVTEAVALAPKGGRPLAVSLLDGAGNVLAELPGSAWVGRGGAADRLAAVLETAGVRWREQRAPQGTGFDDSQDHPLGPAAASARLPLPGEMAFYLPMSAALVAVVALARQAWVALAVCLVIVAWSLWLRRAARAGG
jgi:hypothetical protein